MKTKKTKRRASAKPNAETLRLRKKLKDLVWASKKTNEGIKILYKELAKKNAALKQMDQLKSQFVANVAHELKNPLAVIKEAMQLILDGATGTNDPKAQEILSPAKRSADRLARLVTDILDISRIESGHVKFNLSEVDICALTDEILAAYGNEIERKKIALERSLPRSPARIRADRDKLSEVIINLLTNAVKYTPEGGRISVRVLDRGNEIGFEISDSGPGIPKEYTNKIFDKFERIMAEKYEGTGLGLPIAKDIVELHKGKIWVESEKNRGSRFIFVLPKKPS